MSIRINSLCKSGVLVRARGGISPCQRGVLIRVSQGYWSVSEGVLDRVRGGISPCQLGV